MFLDFDKATLLTVLEIAIFLSGYAIGRRVGIQEGIAEGMSILPLDWRKKLYETCICPLCSHQLNIDKNCDKIHNRD